MRGMVGTSLTPIRVCPLSKEADAVQDCDDEGDTRAPLRFDVEVPVLPAVDYDHRLGQDCHHPLTVGADGDTALTKSATDRCSNCDYSRA